MIRIMMLQKGAGWGGERRRFWWCRCWTRTEQRHGRGCREQPKGHLGVVGVFQAARSLSERVAGLMVAALHPAAGQAPQARKPDSWLCSRHNISAGSTPRHSSSWELKQECAIALLQQKLVCGGSVGLGGTILRQAA